LSYNKDTTLPDSKVVHPNSSLYKGTLRIRQGWSELKLRVGGLGSVSTALYNNWQKPKPSIRSVS